MDRVGRHCYQAESGSGCGDVLISVYPSHFFHKIDFALNIYSKCGNRNFQGFFFAVGDLKFKAAQDFLYETLGKKRGKFSDCKKSELIRVFLESGVDLAGKVPGEILSD